LSGGLPLLSSRRRQRSGTVTHQPDADAPAFASHIVRRGKLAGIVTGTVVAITLCMLAAGSVFAWWLAPQTSEPTIAMVRTLLDTHQLVPALHTVAQISKLDSDDVATSAILDEIYSGLCDAGTDEPNLLVSNPDLRQVARRLLEVTGNRPESSANVALRAGEFALAAGLYSDAITMLKQARAADPGLQGVTTPLALAQLGSERWDELLNVVHPDEGATPHQRAVLWIIRGRTQEKLKQFDDARLSMRAAMEEEPVNLAAISRLGVLELTHGYRGHAKPLLDSARAAAPDAVPTLRLAAEYEYMMGNFTASGELYRGLTKRTNTETYDPIPASLGLARALIYAGDSHAAEEALNAADAILRDDPHVNYYRALLLYRNGDYRRAVELAEPLDTRLKGLPQLDLLLGAASLADGYVQTAAHRLRRYLESEPSNMGARALLNAAEAKIANPTQGTVVTRAELLAAFDFSLP
jgi:tetratricopeptide (TPR) repeat protein